MSASVLCGGVAAKVRLYEGKGEGVVGEDLVRKGLCSETNIYIER